MHQIRIECNVPVRLMLLSDGQYDAIYWRAKDQVFHSFFEIDGRIPTDLESRQIKEAQSLIQRLNRLIRWYRVITADSFASECTLWKASPFRFYEGESNMAWGEPLMMAPASPLLYSLPATGTVQERSEAVRRNYLKRAEPPVSQLFLFDARQALDEGRFREAVLFSWSTIDATFSSRFGELVKQRLPGEWPEAIKFLKEGIHFGIKNRMTIGLRLIGATSFYSEPGDFWNKLSESYRRRNAIIHEGDIASEVDAENAIHVAEEVVRLMDKIDTKTASSS